MPSHTVQSALIQMYLDSGGPWAFPRWKEITGITHGIFPDDDSPLPRGLSRQDLTYIRSYFDQYSKKVKEDDKIKFASATRNSAQVPGRSIWRQWVTDRWRDWKIHTIITSVLKTENYHPVTLAIAARDDPDADEDTKANFWPPGNMYIPLVVDSVVLELFGVEAQNSRGLVPVKTRAIVQALIQRTWKVIHNQVDRSRNRMGKVEEDAIRAFETLNQGSPNKVQIKAVISKVARWRDLTEFLQSKHNLEMMDNMKQALDELMKGLGASVEPSITKPKAKLCTVPPPMLKSLAEKEDVTDVLAMYQDFFSVPSAQDSVDLTEQHPAISFRFGTLEDDADPGVEMESTLSPEILASNLGFKDGLPLLFSRYRHRGGLTSWDTGKAHLFEDAHAQQDPDMDRIVLHWHQLAGVHALVRMVFGPDPDPKRGCGALVADEVGLGKTYQAVIMITFLTDIVLRQKINKATEANSEREGSGDRNLGRNQDANRVHSSMPPIIQQNPYARDQRSLMNNDHPHLIIVPGTLLSQWEVEIKSILKGGTFTIIVYGSGKAHHGHFWGPEGPFQKAKHSGANILIIASHSALQQDFSLLYVWKKPRSGELPWAEPGRMPDYDKTVSDTLYGQKYLSITFDEAQCFRNVNAKHSAGLLIRQQALFCFALTATPLQTSTKDIACLGRLIGIPHFSSQAAFDEEKADASAIRRVKAEDEGVTDGNDTNALTLCQMHIAHRMQTQFEGRVLRRTISSKDWQGKVLIDLPPCKEARLVLKLTDREMDIISELADNVKESMSVANSFLMVASRNFYIEHRMAVNYARDRPEEKIPVFKTLEEWEAKKSTKIDACVNLCAHLLSRDDAPEVYVENGAIVYPPPPIVTDPLKISRRRKIVIYQEFPSHGPLLRNILDLYGIKYLYIDGQTSFVGRAKIVKEFNQGKERRVLIISSVGSTGLNLAVASAMILLDQVWSAQDNTQNRGRIHRQPQSLEVIIYQLLGDETADIVLAAMASGKGSIMIAFVKKLQGRAMLELLQGRSLINDGDDREDDDPDVKESKYTKVRAANAEKAKKKTDRALKITKKKTSQADMDVDKRPTKEAPELVNVHDKPDSDLPSLGGGLTTEGDTSDGDGLTTGATTDGMSEPLTEYDADKSMASSRAPTPHDEVDANDEQMITDDTVVNKGKAPAPPTNDDEVGANDEQKITDEAAVNKGKAPAPLTNDDEVDTNDKQMTEDDATVNEDKDSSSNVQQERGSRRGYDEVSDDAALPAENKKRRLVTYPSSPVAPSSPEPMGDPEQSQDSNQDQQQGEPSFPSDPPNEAETPAIPSSSQLSSPLTTQPPPFTVPPPPTRPQPQPLSNTPEVHRHPEHTATNVVPRLKPLGPQMSSSQPLRRAPAMMKAKRTAHEHRQSAAPKHGTNLRNTFNAIMAGAEGSRTRSEDHETPQGPDPMAVNAAGASSSSASAPPTIQQGIVPPTAKSAKRANPFARNPQGSGSARPSFEQGSASSSSASATLKTKPAMRDNPFARKPQTASAPAGQSSSQEAAAESLRDIPSIRRAVPFTSDRRGHVPLSPPPANAQSKNPFKSKRKRT